LINDTFLNGSARSPKQHLVSLALRRTSDCAHQTSRRLPAATTSVGSDRLWRGVQQLPQPIRQGGNRVVLPPVRKSGCRMDRWRHDHVTVDLEIDPFRQPSAGQRSGWAQKYRWRPPSLRPDQAVSVSGRSPRQSAPNTGFSCCSWPIRVFGGVRWPPACAPSRLPTPSRARRGVGNSRERGDDVRADERS